MADLPSEPVPSFRLFPQLPAELRKQVWKASFNRRRILPVYYDHPDSCWRVCPDALEPNPISQASSEAREIFTSFLGIAILPDKDIILISDPKFALRSVQSVFLNESNVNRLESISFTADVWKGLRHTNHDFPTASLSPATIIRKLPTLANFTLSVCEDDDAELETDSYGYEGEWTEERSEEWGSVEIPTGEDMTHAGRAERFLTGLEQRTLVDMIEKDYPQVHGVLSWRHLGSYESVSELDVDTEAHMIDLEREFEKEQAAHPDWVPPCIDVRVIEQGVDKGEWSDMEGMIENDCYDYYSEDD